MKGENLTISQRIDILWSNKNRDKGKMKCPKCQSDNPETSRFCAECGALLQQTEEIPVAQTETLQTPVKELTTGSAFAGRYQIIEELGKGGMGRVYKVFDAEVKEKVALKLLKPEIAAGRETIERFRNELKFARKIRHKNVCQMFDLAKEENTYYITMEYVCGEDLKSMIRMSKRLSVGTAVDLAKQVCEGLAEAHKLGVVHRDLKPQKIMIDREGNARIMDFGIARSLRGKGITGAGVMIGTPEYMSPEQVEGKDIDQRSDIYSLGVILYEMVTGRVPFEGDTPFTIGMKHKSEIPKDPKELNAQIPEDLSELILRCLEKNKEKRYQSASELCVELEKIEKGIPTTERETPARRPFTSKEITVTFNLKKLIIPVLLVLAIIIAGVIAGRFILKKHGAPTLSVGHSIGVLPFADLSSAKDHEYMCDGISETLINALSSIKDLHVPARTSAFSFKGKDVDVREIGKKLNAETVLEGSVQVSGNRLGITAELVNVADGFQLWSEGYERGVDDIFAIQDEIAQTIVKTLKIKLLGEKEATLVKRYTESREAYDLYMRGLYFLDKRGETNLKKAVNCFQEAIGKDPTYALAYAGLSETFATIGDWNYLPADEAFPKAREAAQQALEIDNSLAEAHCALGQVKYIYDWDWPGAEVEFKRAISLNPNYAVVHKEYGEFLTKLGRFDEALQEMKKAQELDPLSLVILAIGGWPLHYSRQYDQAIEQNKKVLAMDQNFEPAQLYLAQTYLAKGMHEEALKYFKKLNDPYRIGISYAKMDKIAEARQVLESLIVRSKQEPQLCFSISILYFALGEYDRGFQWLEKACEQRNNSMVFLKVEPLFDSVRSDPRFKALLKKVGLEK